MCRSIQTESKALQQGGNGAAATPWGAAGSGRAAQNALAPDWRSSSPLPLQHRAETKPIVFIQEQIQLPLPCSGVQHSHPPPHSSLQPLCHCPLRENQKHEYLKPGDEADTERIQAHPSPAPSSGQEGTRSFCGSQRHATHVSAGSSCCWLAGLCRGSSDAEMTPVLTASWNTGTCSPLRAQILPGGLVGERGGWPGAGYR